MLKSLALRIIAALLPLGIIGGFSPAMAQTPQVERPRITTCQPDLRHEEPIDPVSACSAYDVPCASTENACYDRLARCRRKVDLMNDEISKNNILFAKCKSDRNSTVPPLGNPGRSGAVLVQPTPAPSSADDLSALLARQKQITSEVNTKHDGENENKQIVEEEDRDRGIHLHPGS